MNCAVTFFTNYAAASKTEQLVALDDLAHRIEITTRSDKAKLPWLKLARFGDQISDKGCLRHDANILAVTGIELDYDGEWIAFDEAIETLGAAGILAIVYTSPSHTEDMSHWARWAPRWRVLCPFSQEWPPWQRDRFLARLNGLLGGIAANESWTRSQSYYFGSVNRNPAHRVALLDGVPIDLVHELDAIAIGRPEKSQGNKAPATTNGSGADGQHADPSAITDKRVSGKIESLLANVRAARKPNKRRALIDNGIALGGYLHLTNWSEADAAEELVKALHDEVADWGYAKTLAAWAVSEGKAKPLTLEDRPYGLRRSA